VAVLAALALLNRGHELFLSPVPGASPACGTRLLLEATAAIGADGMIGGQAADLAGSDESPLASRDRKTTTLVRLAAVAGAMAGGAGEADIAALGRYGECLGAAYQMHDDLLDADGGGAAGKTLGQDARHGRASWVAEGGADAARAAAAAAMDEARSAIHDRFGHGPGTALLIEAASAILDLMAGALTPAAERR
jgi:farnesyl diphosphate synthase